MSIYTYLSGLIIACLSYFVYDQYVNTKLSLVKKPDKTYDYIIVGAGTAGCVLAARLSEDPNIKVLLLEAGGQMSFYTNIPLTATAAQLGPYDWSVRTTPQKYSSFGLRNQTQLIPRGKGLGGSGQINFLMHGLGLPKDFQEWQDLGLETWGLADLKPYFRKAFGTSTGESVPFCDRNKDCLKDLAPMKLTKIDRKDKLMQVFKQSSSISPGNKVSFSEPVAAVHRGRRVSTWEAYLKPALNRTNLHVLLKTTAVTIRFRKKAASSLYILQNGRYLNNIFANKEIILSAGAIKTPQILIMSGIGPSDQLTRHKIEPVLVNEHVGKNLFDHMNMPIYVTIDKPISITLAKIFTFTALWDYLWHGQGLLTFPPLAGTEFMDDAALSLFAMGTASERILREISNYKPKVFRETFRHYNSSSQEGFMFLATCTKPRSRGSITLADLTISTPVNVDPNYLHEAHDVRCMTKAIRRAEALIFSKPFQDIGAVIQWPKPEMCMSLWQPPNKEANIKTKKRHRMPTSSPREPESPPEEYLECIIREVAVTGHHVGGTCAGGTVVDEDFRLKSISRLRIVDASVLPTPVSSHPNSLIVGLAEKAAELIKQ